VLRSPNLLKTVGWLVEFIYRRCDLILAQSRSFMSKIQGSGSQKTPVVYFPSWAESVFDLNGVTPASEVPLKPGCFNVMFAGNIGDAQDFPAILSAAEILKSQQNIRWLIVGDGRKAAWVADEIKRRHLEGCVLMLGRYPVERMPSFYKHANALLVSLRDEAIFSMTIPGKLQSYLASGLPILAMLNGEGAELIGNSGAGLTCNAGDHVALAEAVHRLAGMNEHECSQMGQNGLNLSQKEFDRNKLMDQLERWLLGLK
jgi:colanic acid biosynthesis glycosyl transferase WcaI